MNPTALAVLASALLHAIWNTAAKSVGNRWVSTSLMGIGYLLGGLVLVAAGSVPAPTSWPYLAASVILQVAYLFLLTSAYQHGDMSRLYPLIRGLAPLLVTIVALTALDERVSRPAFIGICVLVLGLLVLTFGRGLPRRGAGIGLAVLTGCCIAAYSLVDGLGVRHSGDPIGYAGWLFTLQAPLLVGVARVRHGPGLAAAARPHLAKGVLGGLLSLITYGTVVWAQNRLPLPVVSALRETSVIWALLLGPLFLRERLSRRGAAAAGLALVGALIVDLYQ